MTTYRAFVHYAVHKLEQVTGLEPAFPEGLGVRSARGVHLPTHLHVSSFIAEKLDETLVLNLMAFETGHAAYTYERTPETKAKFRSHFQRRFDDWINGWLSGEILAKGRADCARIRRYLLSKYKGCQQCGWHEVNPASGKIPVQLHHDDGNHANNAPSNLKLLCPNCHSLTVNYMALNKGGQCPNKRW